MPQFREINNGIIAGMPNKEAREKYKDLIYSTRNGMRACPQGESPKKFFERIKAAWEQFSNDISEIGQNVIFF